MTRLRLHPAFFVAFGLLLLYAVWVAETLRSPGLARYDEFLCWGRTKNMVLSGDPFCVHFNGAPDMKKPPLQYWLGAILISAGVDEPLGLRIPSFLFSLGTLLLTGLCGLHLRRGGDPWVFPASAGFLMSSLLFSTHARTAMLETGLCFFVTLAVYSLWKAESDSRWWLCWGAALGLGALQKAPMAWLASLVCGAVLFAGRWCELRMVVKDRWFRSGLVLGLCLTSFWPVLQSCRFGELYWQALKSQGIDRFTIGISENKGEGFGFHPDRLLFLTMDSSIFWVVCTLALAAAVVARREILRDRKLLGVLAFAGVILSILIVAPGPIHTRYILVFTPLMVGLTVSILSRLTPRPWLAPVLALACLTYQSSRLADTPYKEVVNTRVPLRYLARRYGEYLSPGHPGLALVPVHHLPVVMSELPPGLTSLLRRDRVEVALYPAIVLDRWIEAVSDDFLVKRVLFHQGDYWILELVPKEGGRSLSSFCQKLER